jgi:Flp pilus assembly protein TadG
MPCRSSHPASARHDPARSRGGGQALVEFALLLPVFMATVMGLIEYGAAFNAMLSINRASENAAHMAAIAGNNIAADCIALQEIEESVGPPNSRDRILEVDIQRTALAGNTVYASTIFRRGGSTTCTLPDGTTMTVPYVRVLDDYPVAQRCNILSGCPTMTPPRTMVDNIGVNIKYHYGWVTPLGQLLPFVGGDSGSHSGWTFSKRNIFRMEPYL